MTVSSPVAQRSFAAWRRRFRRRLSHWVSTVDIHPRLELAMLLLALVSGALSYGVLTGGLVSEPPGPLLRTLLLVAVLLPVMSLIVLIARRIAVLVVERRRGLTGARMHVRLVGLFSVLAAVPTLLVVVFASLLFQSGTQFWFSDSAQTVLANAEDVAQAYVEENRSRILDDINAMSGDLDSYAQQFGIEGRDFSEGLAWQLAARDLSEAVVFMRGPAGDTLVAHAEAGEGIGTRQVLDTKVAAVDLLAVDADQTVLLAAVEDRVEAIAHIDGPIYLYISRAVDPEAVQAAARAASARSQYSELAAQARELQWQFNIALGVAALFVLAAAILSALWLANRLVAPIGSLAVAAERIGEGDLSARAQVRTSPDELGILARAFNRMAGQLETQTGALVSANARAEERRRFSEAVIEGVSAGIISVDEAGNVELASKTALELLEIEEDRLIERPLAMCVPAFAEILESAREHADARRQVRIERGKDVQTLLVRASAVPGGEFGYVLTFDDVTQQLADQRRAAWADVARRIAHEIKNPLTPIQLSAERLQRRFGGAIVEDGELFRGLTDTIVRQVGDLRRMVDEFSSFARMPKPVFQKESIVEIARQALFLQEVAHSSIVFSIGIEGDPFPLVCDRRQLAQAFTNLLKNAAEAVLSEERAEAKVELIVRFGDPDIVIEVCDNGSGLPPELRERVTEPYVTTRARGTGLGLAIVSKIVEDHGGTLSFLERIEGGTCVRMAFDREVLQNRLDDEGAALESASGA